jgi:type VI secretion system protein ImpJ
MKPSWPRTLQLLPAHLYARDGHVEDLLTLRTGHRVPCVYGILDFAIDEAAAAKGEISVRRLEAILPSGLVVQVEPQAPLRRAIPESSAHASATASFDVFVGVPHAVLRGPNATSEVGPARSTRYASAATPDPMPWMRARPEILFEGEPTDGFEILRLGRAQCVAKSVRFVRDALPTALRLRASGVLDEGLRKLIQVFEARRRELVRYRADHPLHLASIVAEDLPGLQLSVILQRYLPLLSDLAARRTTHPHELYGTLAAAHGALLAFAAAPEIAPAYDHDDQGKVFPWLFERITRLVDEAARGGSTVLPFKRINETTFRLAFERGALVGKRLLLVLTGGDEEFLRERVPSLLKMASPAAIVSLLDSAVRGVAVAVEFEPPPVVPRTRGSVAYRIDVRDPHWLDIEDRMAIQLHLVGAPTSLEAFLYAVEGRLA